MKFNKNVENKQIRKKFNQKIDFEFSYFNDIKNVQNILNYLM